MKKVSFGFIFSIIGTIAGFALTTLTIILKENIPIRIGMLFIIIGVVLGVVSTAGGCYHLCNNYWERMKEEENKNE